MRRQYEPSKLWVSDLVAAIGVVGYLCAFAAAFGVWTDLNTGAEAKPLYVADGPPELDVRPSCRGAAAAAAPKDAQATLQRCVESEDRARATLVSRWSDFRAADRIKCSGGINGFEPTYTELLTCLEMADDTHKQPGTK